MEASTLAPAEPRLGTMISKMLSTASFGSHVLSCMSPLKAMAIRAMNRAGFFGGSLV
jgi:hypothetical protein